MNYTFEELEVGEKFIDKKLVNAPFPINVFVKVYDDKAIRLSDGYLVDFDGNESIVRVIF